MDRILKKTIQATYLKIIMKIKKIRTLNNNNHYVTTNTACLVDEANSVSILCLTFTFGS